jgi:AraC-like DNA-binding protein
MMTANRLKKSGDDFEQIAEAGEYIRDNYGSFLTISMLARIACMCPSKFKLRFRERYGLTVYGYIRVIRMDRALELLAESDIAISDIAGLVGYRKPGAFSAAFRKITGMRPSAFRKVCGGAYTPEDFFSGRELAAINSCFGASGNTGVHSEFKESVE